MHNHSVISRELWHLLRDQCYVLLLTALAKYRRMIWKFLLLPGPVMVPRQILASEWVYSWIAEELIEGSSMTLTED